MEGWIKIHRQMCESPLYGHKPFCRAMAWIDLLLLANHKEEVVWKRGIPITLHRGEVGWSQRDLAKRWGWSRGKVEQFLKYLESERQIKPQNEPKNLKVSSRIIIVNYEKYQAAKPENQPKIGPKIGPKTAVEPRPERFRKPEECKEGKEENLCASADARQGEAVFLTAKKRALKGKRLEWFERFWDAFDYKKGKAAAADSWFNIPVLTDPLCEKIVAAARGEALRRQRLLKEGRTPKMAQGWLTERRWEDDIKAEEVSPCRDEMSFL